MARKNKYVPTVEEKAVERMLREPDFFKRFAIYNRLTEDQRRQAFWFLLGRAWSYRREAELQKKLVNNQRKIFAKAMKPSGINVVKYI